MTKQASAQSALASLYADEDALSQSAFLMESGKPVKVHYTDTHPGSAKHATVALLHGSGPGSTGWNSFTANRSHLLDAGFRLISIDHPGWGRSDPLLCKGDRSVLNARALDAVLRAAKIDGPIHVVGASMGAHSAAAFAIEWPQRTAKLVLVSGGSGGCSSFHSHKTEGVRMMLDFYHHPNATTMRRFLEAVPFDAGSISDAVVSLKLAAAKLNPEHLENFSRSIQEHPDQFGDVASKLHLISSPTLVVWGSDDRFVPLDIGLMIATRIPNADMHVFRRCGHVPHLERTAEFNYLLTEFLTN